MFDFLHRQSKLAIQSKRQPNFDFPQKMDQKPQNELKQINDQILPDQLFSPKPKVNLKKFEQFNQIDNKHDKKNIDKLNTSNSQPTDYFSLDPTNYFPRIEGMKEEYPTDTGAFERLIGAIEEEATHIHHHTKEQDYLHKAALVQFARAQWFRITKKKSAIKPSLTSPFYKYLIDLVKYVDQTWSLDTLLRAERRIRE